MGVATNSKPLTSIGIIDPRDYGARADGTTDCTAAVNAAMAAAVPGSTIFFPPGTWLFAGNLTCQDGVSLVGTGRGMSGLTRDPPQSIALTQGTVFAITGGAGTTSASATPFLTLADAVTIAGIAFDYPNQGSPGHTDPPVVGYPYTIGTPYASVLTDFESQIGGVTIQDCVFIRAYQAIRLWSCFPFTVEDCYISAYVNGIWVDQCKDTSTIRRVMVTPFSWFYGTTSGPSVPPIMTNLIAYRFQAVDSVILTDSMVFMCSIGVLLDNTATTGRPAGPWVFMDNCVMDVCDIGIDVQAIPQHGIRVNRVAITTPPSPYTGFTLLYGIGVRLGAAIGASTGTFTLANSYIGCASGNEVAVAGGRSLFTGCNFNSGGAASGSAPSVVATGGNVAVTDCTFTESRPQMAFSGGGKAIFANNTTGAGGVSVTGVTASNCV